MVTLINLWIPAILAALVRYLQFPRWAVLLAVVAVIPLMVLCAIILIFDPSTLYDPVRAAAFYAGALISTIIGTIAGKLLRERPAQ